MLSNLRSLTLAVMLSAAVASVCADVITDWSEKEVALVAARSMPPAAKDEGIRLAKQSRQRLRRGARVAAPAQPTLTSRRRGPASTRRR